MLYQPMLDAIAQMDTGLELPPAAIKAAQEHRQYYNTFLKTQREAREAKNKAKHVTPPDAEKFLFGNDLGLDTFSGCIPLVPPLPTDAQPLFLNHPYGEGYDAKAGLSSQLFDPFRTGGKKYKPRPEGNDEVQECKATLKPDELGSITGGPKTIDFGTFSVFTNVTRSFTVLSELRQNCLVAIDLAEEPDIKQCPPQVIPPNGVAGFDLTFSSDTPGHFRRTITYTVNGAHAFKFIAQAHVEPIDLQLSTEEAVFRFTDGSLEPTVSQTVLLTNPGTHPAAFRWEHPEGSVTAKKPAAFLPSIVYGEVPPKKALPVEVTYAPYLGAAQQHVLTAIVEGGAAKSLYCKADVAESRCFLNTKRLDFGTITAGIAKERTFLVKNGGSSEAVFTFEEPPAGWLIKPMRAAVRVGGSCEVSIEVIGVPPEGQKILEMNATLKCDIRCGKPIKLPVSAKCEIPKIDIYEDFINFGGVVAGATNWQPLTLTNKSGVPATLHLDLSPFPDILIKLGGDAAEAAEAAAAAAADDRATTVIPDEEEESPLQLLTFPNQSPPPTSHGVPDTAGSSAPMDAGMQQQMEQRQPEKRIYAVLVAPTDPTVPDSGKLQLKIGFAPKSACELITDLPLCGVGLQQAPELRKVIKGEGLKPRLKLEPVTTNLGNCILRDAQFPYTTTASVTNADEELLTWRLKTEDMPADCGIVIEPSSGELQPGEMSTITVSFAATVEGIVDVAIPLYINGDESRPYLTPRFLANAVPPRLTFDRPELVLPTVPLNHTARASLYVHNEGYDNLQIRKKLPLEFTDEKFKDDKKGILTVEFPEGELVGVSKDKIMITVTFKSSKATAFTAFIELIDAQGNRFPLPVTATTDNSVLTVQNYLSGLLEDDPYASCIMSFEGKPPKLEPPKDPAGPPKGLSAKDLKKFKSDNAMALFLPPTRSDDVNATQKSLNERAATIMVAYVSSALLDLPAPANDASKGGGAFPSMLTANKARAALDVIQMVSGKTVPLPDPPTDRKNEKLALRHEMASMDAVLAFLRAHGAMLAHVKPEMLLPLEEYMKLLSGGGQLSRKERKAIRKDHEVRHPEGWIDVLFQSIKVFVLGRITPKAFRSLPGMGSAAADISKEVNAKYMADSTLYSSSEVLLLKWLEYHAAACPPSALGVGNPLDDVGGLLNSFDVQLRDGHVFAKVILNHCPFLATIDPNAPPTTATGDLEEGTSIDNLYPKPCAPAAAAANLGIVLPRCRRLACASLPARARQLAPSELAVLLARDAPLCALPLPAAASLRSQSDCLIHWRLTRAMARRSSSRTLRRSRSSMMYGSRARRASRSPTRRSSSRAARRSASRSRAMRCLRGSTRGASSSSQEATASAPRTRRPSSSTLPRSLTSVRRSLRSRRRQSSTFRR